MTDNRHRARDRGGATDRDHRLESRTDHAAVITHHAVSVSIGAGSAGSLHHALPCWLGPLVRPAGSSGPTGVA
jgi:hypothetical protein